jgi:hypothetical protein
MLSIKKKIGRRTRARDLSVRDLDLIPSMGCVPAFINSSPPLRSKAPRTTMRASRGDL